MQYKTIYIKEIIEEVSGFKTFIFGDNDISYTPGQYLTLVHKTQHEEIRRSYSITSTPILHEPLSIGIKRMDNGFFSRWMTDSVKTGTGILTTGAGGFFTLPEDTGKPQTLFFFAAGSGITPILSLIKTALHGYPQFSVILVYSSSFLDRTAFLEILQQLTIHFPSRFKLELLISSSTALFKARLNRELMLELLQKHSNGPREALYYICGPEAYMRLCTFTLHEAGIHSGQIKKEHFVIDGPRHASLMPPDKQTHEVTIHLGVETYTVTVHYPDSILKAARKQNILMPYSCETGRCGSCAAVCTKGKIWHSYNEVLTEKELRQSLILTCVGHPVEGNATIEIKQH